MSRIKIDKKWARWSILLSAIKLVMMLECVMVSRGDGDFAQLVVGLFVGDFIGDNVGLS